MIVLQAQRPAMQLGDGGDEGKAEAGARAGPAVLQAHEALENPATLMHGNTGAVIRDGDEHAGLAHDRRIADYQSACR